MKIRYFTQSFFAIVSFSLFLTGCSQFENPLEVPGTGTLQVITSSDSKCTLLREAKPFLQWSGSRTIPDLLTGEYKIKVNFNPSIPDYEALFILSKQELKVLKTTLGKLNINTKSDYQNLLFFNGTQILSWTGSQELGPAWSGNYSLHSRMFPGATIVSQDFNLDLDESKTVGWEYGTVSIDATNAECVLLREDQVMLRWSGSKTLDSLITGNYLVEIQVPNSPIWSEAFTLTTDLRKNVSIPYGLISVTTNVPTSTTKLIFNGAVINTIVGNGTLPDIVPGDYTLSVEAQGYVTTTENISVSNGQVLEKYLQLFRPSFSQMVIIPVGSFTMGCTSEQSNCNSDENPTHQVTLSAYEIGKYEVTQKEWRTVMGSNPAFFTGDNKPVEQVSWNDIITFCNALSLQEGLTPVYTINGSTVSANWYADGYRLPTEAEWEYAARGGALSTNTRYSGSNIINDVSWFSSNSSSKTHDIGSKSPNQLGIYDMSGNVWEWCWDWYSPNYYTQSIQTDPKGPDAGSGRVLRGGSWYNYAERCRISYRYDSSPSSRNSLNGFRLARTR